MAAHRLPAASTLMWLSSSGNFVTGDEEAGGETEGDEQNQSMEGRTGPSAWTGWELPIPWDECFLLSSQSWSLRMNTCYPSSAEPRIGGS